MKTIDETRTKQLLIPPLASAIKRRALNAHRAQFLSGWVLLLLHGPMVATDLTHTRRTRSQRLLSLGDEVVFCGRDGGTGKTAVDALANRGA